MSSLLELAERCEQATGPTRGLDNAIRLATSGGSAFGDDPAYTASIDAAMLLVPDDCLAMVEQLWDGESKATLARVSRYGKSMWTGDWSGLSALPAPALCAAALRARAASVDRSPEGGDHEDGRHAEHESAVPEGDAQ